jgi:hypothetical protein
MSDVDLDQLLESLGDMTVSQAREFLRALNADLAAAGQQKPAPAPSPADNHAATVEEKRLAYETMGEQLRRKPLYSWSGEERKSYQEVGRQYSEAINAQNQAILDERQAAQQAANAPAKPTESAEELAAQLAKMRSGPAHLINRAEYNRVYSQYKAAIQAEQAGSNE